ncbi:cytochrome b [Alishewanella sp. SMS8]|uniref:cytochrome b n=1 Tax=Alishewanella sp. SMS8 TaxID=2994676 RepID=UPI0027417A31|nr:cytochrome b/b6 domain-containing protein [Alishewanella sp. SMS8]MDP4945888.1 cytochrome b/b6 domain-containing protein [Alishewanella sp.]MDP5035278.1 cytochrome b/b6 domain-containing protein [Alishewanella sp.]MDP5186534.1 cytochrome b/b6 domain-containing protein [Alishewanella sp.]MDP5459044.1 cytochrome b/b6 domain-containing protein [Alishewanella sp. SMS8]
MNNPATYSLAMRLMHWLMAALVLSLLLAGLTMVSALGAWQQQLLSAHKMAGLLAACAVLLRIYLRLTSQVPALPSSLPLWQQWAAKLTHFAFYLLLVLMPLSGYLMQNAAGLPVVLFDVSLPMLLATDLAHYGLLRELHGWASVLLMLLIILHISAALQHGFIKRDGVLASMLKKSA